MVRDQPIEPNRPEISEQTKYTLIKAMGVAIAAIAKEKDVLITSAQIDKSDGNELIIKVVVPSAKKMWDDYNSAKSEYNADFSNWIKERDCEKFGITENQRKNAEEKYYAYRKSTDYEYPEKKTREDFYKEEGE